MEKEYRYFNGDIEVREGDDKQLYIEGYALKFNKRSRDFGGFYEVINERSLDETDLSDVMARVNHQGILGRTSNGTLQLEKRSDGLYYRIAVPNTTIGKDTIENIRRGDISGSSFAFPLTGLKTKVSKDKDGNIIRSLESFANLIDVGPVDYPAYPDTTAGARDVENFKKELEAEKPEEKVEVTEEKPVERTGLSISQKIKLAQIK